MEPSSPHSPKPPMFDRVSPDLPPRPMSRRSAELKANKITSAPPFAQPLTPPATATTTAAPTEEMMGKDDDDDDTEMGQRTPQHPLRPPPIPPKVSESPSEKMLRSAHSKPQAYRAFSQPPVPSTMSGLLAQQRLPEEFQSSSAPPSPPLTRRSITPSYCAFQRPPVAQSISSASLKSVRKAGKTLGQNPIDYLLPNGSLPEPVSSYFHPAWDPLDLTPPPNMRDEEPENPVAGIFDNLTYLLDSYLAVLSAGGSIAVGTGYQSVARKLLERVENVFARNLGVEGVGWADVLEYLRGGKTKPFLCVLPVRGLLAKHEEQSTLGSEVCTTRELAESVVAGVQVKSAMTKVEQWLEEVQQVLKATEPDDSCCPGGAEEDRMVIEIIEGILANHTEADQIKNFHRFLSNRALITSMTRALSILYPDHDIATITAPIVALYLLLHPELHPLLAALSRISDAELELINSGRFDSFLDGAANVVLRDEDEELAVISTLDNRLWSVLEGLEDEIEELHNRALIVRRALKSRRECIIKKRPVTPVDAPKPADEKRRNDEEDWADNVPTLNVPIMPDDSASNIAYHRRKKEGGRKKDKDKDKEKKPRMSMREFSFRNSEFGGTAIGEEEEDRDTTVSRRRRRKERSEHGGGKCEHAGEDEKRKKERCGTCGSCITQREDKRRERKERGEAGDEKDKERRERRKDREERTEDREQRRKEHKEKKEAAAAAAAAAVRPS